MEYKIKLYCTKTLKCDKRKSKNVSIYNKTNSYEMFVSTN